MSEKSTGSLLREVATIHEQLQRESVACCSTTSTQCEIITELGRSGDITLADLGRRLGLDKSWMSRAVDGLTQEGLLTKQPGEEDRRTILIALSPVGETRCCELNVTLEDLSERVMKHIPESEHATVHHALELLHAALKTEAANSYEKPVINCC